MKVRKVIAHYRFEMDDGRALTLDINATCKTDLLWEDTRSISFAQLIDSDSPDLQGRKVSLTIEKLRQ